MSTKHYGCFDIENLNVCLGIALYHITRTIHAEKQSYQVLGLLPGWSEFSGNRVLPSGSRIGREKFSGSGPSLWNLFSSLHPPPRLEATLTLLSFPFILFLFLSSPYQNGHFYRQCPSDGRCRLLWTYFVRWCHVCPNYHLKNIKNKYWLYERCCAITHGAATPLDV